MEFFKNVFGNKEELKPDNFGHQAVPKSGEESLPTEEFDKVHLENEIDNIIERLRVGKEDRSSLLNKLEILGGELKKKIDNMKKDLEENKEGNSGIVGALEEDIKIFEEKLKEVEEIIK